MNKKSILNFVIIFLLVYLGFTLFFNKNEDKSVAANDFTLATTKQQYAENEVVDVKISNNTDQTATIKNDCPDEPFTVLFYKNNQWAPKTYTAHITCPPDEFLTIAAKQQQEVKYQYWNHSLFNEVGHYKIVADIVTTEAQVSQTQETQSKTTPEGTMQSQLIMGQTETSQQQTPPITNSVSQQIISQQQANAGSSQQGEVSQQQTQQTSDAFAPTPVNREIIKKVESNEFEVVEPNIFSKIWTTIFYQPIYNILIFLASVVPYHDLGLAIILLTIIIRTILLIPSQKGLKSQRKLQEIQPKIAHLKEKHKDNQEMIAKETMALWKEHKVNPVGGCLPLLIQFPVLIALFYVIQSGLNPDNVYLLYEPLKNFPLASMNLNFLGILDLSKVNFFVLPLIVGSLQFFQMKLATMRSQKAQEKTKKKEDKKPTKGDEMQIANQMMTYVMPVMIAIFTASVPAGVGLYWSTSTLYGIVQQIFVNKQVASETASVKVLPPKK